MILMPQFRAPYDDEYLQGWILSLAYFNMNGSEIYRYSDFIREYFFPEKEKREKEGKKGKNRREAVRGLDAVSRRFPYEGFPNQDQIISNMTAIPVIGISRTYELTAEYIQYMLRAKDGTFFDDMWHYNSVRPCFVCESCMEEDREEGREPYFRTWHHLPGVRVCAKHCVRLKRIRQPECGCYHIISEGCKLEDIDEYGDPEAEVRYAKFLYAAYLDKPDFSVYETKMAIKEKLLEIGYWKDKDIFVGKFRELHYDSLCQGDIRKVIKWILSRSEFVTELVYVVCSFLFQDYQEFKRYALRNRDERFLSPAQEDEQGFEMLSDNYDVPTIHLRCRTCKTDFYCSPFSLKIGMGCQECDSRLSAEEFINRQLSKIGNGRYRLDETYKGYGKKHRLIDKQDGLLENAVLCKKIRYGFDGNKNSEARIKSYQNRLDPEGGRLQVLSVVEEMEDDTILKIKDIATKRLTNVSLNLLIDRIERETLSSKDFCDDDIRSDFTKRYDAITHGEFCERVKAMEGDAYTVLDKYIGAGSAVKIRHNRCGCVFSAYPVNFLYGQRCPLCTSLIRCDAIPEIVRDCTAGNCSSERMNKSYYRVIDAEGREHRMTPSYIINELFKEGTDSFLKPRVAMPNRKILFQDWMIGDIIVYIREHGSWIMREHVSLGHPEYNQIAHRLGKAVKDGYLIRIERGVYGLPVS